MWGSVAARLREWIVRLAGTLGRSPADPDLEHELRVHIELAAEDARRRDSPDGARRPVRRDAGGITQAMEALRGQRGFPWLDGVARDVRHACRMLANSPGFTAIAVMSIALGTGANVAIFSATDALLLRPLPIVRPGELMTVGTRVKYGLAAATIGSYPDYVDIRDRNQSLDGVLAYTAYTTGITMRPGTAPQVKVITIASGNYFQLLGVEPEIGRAFRADEDRVPGRDAVTILSHDMWKAGFGGDPSVLGRTIQIAGVEFTVIGVAPERFTGLDTRPIRESAFVPLAMWPRLANAPVASPLDARGLRALTLKGRLKPGVTLTEARAEMATIARDLERAYPDTNRDVTLTITTELARRYERSPIESGAVTILSVLSFAVLCVACANVAGLLSSRAPVRAREIALRIAIGAGRGRLLVQLFVESLLIAIAGTAGGLFFGYVGIVLLRQYHYSSELDAVPIMRLDERALAFSLALAVASALLFGLAPAMQMTRVDVANALKTTAGATGRRTRIVGRNALVGLQVALSLVLLTVGVFAIQIFSRQLVAGPGFRTAHMAKLTIDPGQARYSSMEAMRFFERAVDSARHQPGIAAAGLTSGMPFSGGWAYRAVVPQGYRLTQGQTAVHTWTSSIDEGYFGTMGMVLIAGRDFRATDTAERPRVAIVNETFARHYWGERRGVGERVSIADALPALTIEVVGVVKTVDSFYPGEPAQEMMYLPFRQEPRDTMVLLAQTTAGSGTALAPLRDMLWRMDAGVPVYNVQTMETFYDAWYAGIARSMLGMIGGMAVIGVMLTIVGLYGLVSYAVSRRTREFGIRIAVGATYSRVVAMVLRQGMAPALVGLIIGLGLSVMTARALPTLVPLSDGYNPAVVIWLVPVLLGVTLLAAFVPARRAARVDPIAALRCE